MSEPWVDPVLFVSIYPGFAGGLGGTLIGVAGGIGGDLARKGQRRLWTRLVLVVILVFGLVSLAAGVVVYALSQPSQIWLTLAGIGLLLSVVAAVVLRALRRMYEQAVRSRLT